MKHHRLQAKATLPSEKIFYVGSTCLLYFLGPLPSESALLLQCSGLEVKSSSAAILLCISSEAQFPLNAHEDLSLAIMGAARLTEKDSPHHCNTDEVIGTLVCPTGNYDILRRMVRLRNTLKSLWLFLKGVCVCVDAHMCAQF